MTRKTVPVLLCLVLAAGVPGCKQETFDPRDLADALSEEMTDALDFDNSDVMAGAPPEADPTGPQMSAYTAPLLVGASVLQPDGTPIGFPYEEIFTITLYGPTGLTTVKGAIAHVRQANKDDSAAQHIRIEPAVYDQLTGEMTLTARVHRQDSRGQDVSGNSFHVGLAMLVDDGGSDQVGNYLEWNLSTYPATGGDNKVPVCKCRSEFEGGALKYTNVAFLGECSTPPVLDEYNHANPDVSPCSLWNQYASGYNTNSDLIMQIMPDPSYQDTATVKYAAGTRFYPTSTMVEITEQIEACTLEIECPTDDVFCRNNSDCSLPDDLCCNNTCTNSRTDPDHCGDCGTVCGAGALCRNGSCGGDPVCGDPTVLAGWNFEDAMTGTQPFILEPNVIAQRFTSNTPPPEQRFGGGFAWLLEDGWMQEGTFFSCTIAAMPGYEIRFSMLTFDHSIPNVPAPPTWRLTHVHAGAEIQIGAGSILPQPLQFNTEIIDLPGTIIDSTEPIEFRWFAEGSDELWGLDNVMIHGEVCSIP
ncbi:hypothetical protein ACFL2F_00185 [Myxococcota bacterium]